MFRRAVRYLLVSLVVPSGILVQFAGAQADPPQRAVLVTGASSGIGRKIAERLASSGFFVYAGARKASDLAELDAIPNVQSVRLDVTIPSEIAAAVETVRKGGRGLYGLVNNAGVAVIEPLIETDEEDLRFQLDVNVMGPYRVTKAFSPLLIASKGRIVTTGSLSGFLSGSLSGPYSMSKHAVEAFTDALAAEMARFDVKVSVLEPGNYQSDIGQSLLARMKARGKSFEGSPYEEDMKRIASFASGISRDPEPDDVAEAAYAALTDPSPKLRYLVVPNQGQARLTIASLFRRAAQLNQGQKYTFSRDSLVAMLDQALAAGGRTR
jgi:NAD(P)-dependent dehydrogenase (short-subunit alcohol dehydrogenase family)